MNYKKPEIEKIDLMDAQMFVCCSGTNDPNPWDEDPSYKPGVDPIGWDDDGDQPIFD